MKRTFLAKRNSLLSSANISWGLLALVIAVCIFFIRILSPNFFWYAFTPLFRAGDALTTQSHVFFSGFANASTLALENEQLASENAALASENQALLEKEKTLGAFSVSKGTVVGVIARPPVSPYDTLVLSGGSHEGVILGQEAFGAGGIPLGIVSAVLTDFSQLTLFSAPDMKVNGWVGNTDAPLTLMGSGAGTMSSRLPRSSGVSVGDLVFVSGPGALPIGTVTHIDSDASSPSITLHIQPLFNPFSITWVELRTTGASFSTATSSLP